MSTIIFISHRKPNEFIFRKFVISIIYFMVLYVNGEEHDITVEPDVALLTILREHLNLTGTKYGCGEGACGACTVLINGNTIHSCITPAGAAAGKDIITIEGLEKDEKLAAVQHAFVTTDVFQCSYCASGMIMAAAALLKKNPSPSEEAIVQGMNGNICRCGTYPYIIKAIKLASSS
jgi:aerobic-type carbon monoxide dehydrogenase small subunit (CoxS/CutS family)